jgi:hypothetical protein
MCGSVISYQSGPVKAKDHIQILQSNIMDNLIIGSLYESRINVTEGK